MRQEKINPFWTKSDINIVSESKSFNQGILYALQKGQKLSSAVHLVTDRLGHSEPLRSSLRSSSISILHAIADLFAGNALELVRVEGLMVGIISYLTVAEGSRSISSANVAVLRNEYEALRQLLGRVSSLERSAILAEALIPEGRLDQKMLSGGQSHTRRSKKDISNGHSNVSLTDSTATQRLDRRRIVLDLLSKNQRITIRNLATAITGVSEKTLQRELIAMVQEGVLKKEGERRWSSYSLSVTEVPTPGTP